MTKRIFAIAVIFAGTSVAWMILGSTIFSRTYDRGHELSGKVASTWGTQQEQMPPAATLEWTEKRESATTENGKTTKRLVDEHFSEPVPLEASRIGVAFDLDYRQKGLLWYSTYKVDFTGGYTFTNADGHDGNVTFRFPFPAAQAVYDNLQFTVDGKARRGWVFRTARRVWKAGVTSSART